MNRPRRALGGVVLALMIAAAWGVGRSMPIGLHLPKEMTSVTEVRPSPNVVLAVRELARLESADFHMERVIELTDTQSRLFGLVDAKDALLLVAVGDVTAGVDLSSVGEGDVKVDAKTRRVDLRLPAPTVLTVAIDNTRTHVVSRRTDTLATRNEALEGAARTEAETSMRAAAEEAKILDRARAGAERALRDLLHALGFQVIEIEWRTS